MILVDEITKNTEDVFEDLRTRLRWPGIVNTKFAAATNPGGIGHAWVKKKWLDGIHEEEEKEKEKFYYVPAMVKDNPHIDKSRQALFAEACDVSFGGNGYGLQLTEEEYNTANDLDFNDRYLYF